MRAWTAVSLMVLALLPWGAACSYKVVHDHRVNPAGVEKLLTQVERLRGLKAKGPLRVKLEGRSRLKSGATADLHRASFLQRMEDLSNAWTKVGLIPPGTDLAGAYTSVGSDAPAGYYETSDGILRVIDRQNPRSEIIEIAGLMRQRDLVDGEVLAHEITHALQDMHFNLDAFLSGAPNDDAALARRCLAEGDASFVGYAYSSVFTPSMESWLRFVESRVSALDVGGAPDFVNRRFQLPYLQGARFVGMLHKKGGWDAVNRAYVDPPASTEEILHPLKFLDGRDRPRDIRLPAMQAHLPDGARELWQDTVGELGLRTVLQRERPVATAALKPTASDAAEGWDGDRASVHQAGGALTLTWKMGFDSEEDAVEGFTAYRQMMMRYPGFAADRSDDTQLLGRTGAVGAAMERRGLTVVVLEGYPIDRQLAALDAVFSRPDGTAFDPPGETP